MNWGNIKVGLKILIGFGLVLVLLAVVTGSALLGFEKIIDSDEKLKNYNNLQRELLQREIDHLDWVKSISTALIEGEARELQVQTDYQKCAFGQWFYGEKRQELESLIHSTAELLSQIETPHIQIHETAIEMNALLDRWNADETNSQTMDVFVGKTLPGLKEFRTLILQIREQVEKETDLTEQEMLDVIANNRSIVIGSSILAVFAGIGMAILITLSITRPLRTVVNLAKQIVLGDLTLKASLGNRQDEVGILAASFSQMLESFREIAHVAAQIALGELNAEIQIRSEKDEMGKSFIQMLESLKKMTTVAEQIADGNLQVEVPVRSEKDALGNALAVMVKNLSEQTIEVIEGVNVLVSSASEISSSVTQLAASAAETSTSVGETTTTLEEVRQTSQLANQKAQQVSTSAQQSAQIAQSGRKATEDTVAGMSRIREQMASIADSIVKLSEQSQAIGGIISTVSDLADQSNLLAVNASIEATKAGEQGKGFTVVAQEIRSLAEQSKQATTQVQTILNNIQKATGAAVMATEQGTRAVETGMKQATGAGESIQILAKNIVEAAQAMGQIAVSSQEQVVGMNQIAEAMESIRLASTQNVDSSNQLELSAQNLQELGHRLKQLVDTYTV